MIVPEFPSALDRRSGTVMTMILVTGATGTIGSEVVRLLDARGEKVRALTRDPARARLPAGVEVVRGDYLDGASVTAAMSGATAAFLVGVLGAQDKDRDQALVEAAREAGVSRVVKLSAIGTGDPGVGQVGAWHLAGEQAVAQSGLAWTILRPSAFASNTASWAEPIRSGGPVPNLTGTGAQGVIDPRDVAEVAAESLCSARHTGRTYTLTGPELVTVADQAATLTAVLGRTIDTVDVPADAARTQLLASGSSAAQVDGMSAGLAYIRTGRNAVLTDDVADVLGRPARTYREWAQDHKSIFGGS